MAQVELIILPDNKYCSFITEDEKLFKKVDKILSYKEPGSEFSVAYKRFGWNGINHLMNKNGKFPAGLLDTVKSFLEEYKIDFNVKDERLQLSDVEPLDISRKLSLLKKNPRYYQINAVRAAVENRRGIIKATTGSGKTLIAAILTAALNRPTNIFVIGLDLLQQFHDLFSSIFNEEIGYIGNGICEIKRINIISLWTAAKSLSSSKQKIKVSDDDDDEKEKFNESDSEKIQSVIKSSRVIIFDECHSASTESFKKIYSKINPEFIYGMSGTPYKLEETDLLIKALLGDIIFDIKASELIEKGYLIKPIIKFFYVPKEHIINKTYTNIYKEYVVENTLRNGLIVNCTKKLVDNGFQTLILFRQISHGKKLLQMMREKGIEVEMLSGKDKLHIRNDVKDRLLSGELRCVLSSSIYDTGVDIPSLNALVLASPNKSLIRALQRIGRVIRTSPGKTEVRVVDFYDDAMYLKTHSKRRYQIYKQENGFEIFLPDNIKI